VITSCDWSHASVTCPVIVTRPVTRHVTSLSFLLSYLYESFLYSFLLFGYVLTIHVQTWSVRAAGIPYIPSLDSHVFP